MGKTDTQKQNDGEKKAEQNRSREAENAKKPGKEERLRQREKEEKSEHRKARKTLAEARLNAAKSYASDAAKSSSESVLCGIKAADKAVCAAFSKLQNALAAFAKHRFVLLLFAVPLFFCFVWVANVGGWDVLSPRFSAGMLIYQFYLCDYSAGFCSRLLIGALISLFADKLTIADINAIANISLLVLYALQALLAGAVLRKSLVNKQPLLTLLVFVFALNPLTSQQNLPLHGSLDVFIIILFMVWLFAVDKKITYFITPVLCVVCLSVHYHFLFSFLPAVLALLIYKMFCSQTKKERRSYAVSFGVSSALSGGLFIYFVFFAQRFLKTTADAFYERMASRFDLKPYEQARLESFFNGNVIFRDYFDYYVFGEYEGQNYFNNMNDFFDFLKNYTLIHSNNSTMQRYLSFIAPLFIVFIALWVFCAVKEKGVKKLPYIAFMCIPLVLIPELIISTDIFRWIGAAIICQFAIISVTAADKNSAVGKLIGNRVLNHPAAAALLTCCAALYICMEFDFAHTLPVF